MILLNTSSTIDLYKGVDSTKPRLGGAEREECDNHDSLRFEVLAGAYHLRLKEEERHFARFFSTVRLLSVDRPSAEQASRIVGELMRIGKQVNALDAIIAGIALVNKAEAMVTRDEDFLEIAEVADLNVRTY